MVLLVWNMTSILSIDNYIPQFAWFYEVHDMPHTREMLNFWR